jgi:hypothetical protein
MKSVFDNLKESICKDIMKTQSLSELKEKLLEIPEDYDLEEE